MSSVREFDVGKLKLVQRGFPRRVLAAYSASCRIVIRGNFHKEGTSCLPESAGIFTDPDAENAYFFARVEFTKLKSTKRPQETEKRLSASKIGACCDTGA